MTSSSKRKKAERAFKISDLMNLFSEAGILKKVPRTGWLWRNVPDCESIADHCYRVNIIAMFLCDLMNSEAINEAERFDAEKVLRMAILHEIAECRVGDIPYPAQKYLGAANKTKAETAAVTDMTGEFSQKAGTDYAGIWKEFEHGKSREGMLVKAADKIEMLLQALEYERAGVKTLGDFWENAATFKQIAFTPFLEKIVEHLMAEHEKNVRASAK